MKIFTINKCLHNFIKTLPLKKSTKKLSLLSSLNQEHTVKREGLKESLSNGFRCVNNDQLPIFVDLDVCPHWNTNDEGVKLIRDKLLSDMRVLPSFINDDEERTLLDELEPILKKMRYEYNHWDDAIHGFREMERIQWGGSKDIIEKAKQTGIVLPQTPLPHMHVLDLEAKGYIKPHVDAVRFCGPTVAGICLLSPAVMRLRHTAKTELFADFFLPRKCFYIMSKSSRYDFTHEILKNEISKFKNQEVVRTRRISVITRSHPIPGDRER